MEIGRRRSVKCASGDQCGAEVESSLRAAGLAVRLAFGWGPAGMLVQKDRGLGGAKPADHVAGLWITEVREGKKGLEGVDDDPGAVTVAVRQIESSPGPKGTTQPASPQSQQRFTERGVRGEVGGAESLGGVGGDVSKNALARSDQLDAYDGTVASNGEPSGFEHFVGNIRALDDGMDVWVPAVGSGVELDLEECRTASDTTTPEIGSV